MKPLLELLQKNARMSLEEIADRLSLSAEDVAEQIDSLEKGRTILGFHAVVDRDRAGNQNVVAHIEVQLTPERGGGFDRLARRIAGFSEVTSCFLMSGGYDLAVIVEGSDLREVAGFVSERLSSLPGVRSTATHFQLKVYKQAGFLATEDAGDKRLAVSP